MNAIYIIGWIVCGIIAAGHCYAHEQDGGPWPEYSAYSITSDSLRAIIFGVAGPVALFVSLVVGGVRYGWRMPFTGSRSFKDRLKKQIQIRGYR